MGQKGESITPHPVRPVVEFENLNDRTVYGADEAGGIGQIPLSAQLMG